jgi:hypothetical protein
MTLAYAGPIADLKESDLNAMTKDAISAARVTGTFSLNVTSVDRLGEGEDEVDVLMLHATPQLLVARNIVSKWDRSGFPDYKPHATIGPVGSAFADKVGYIDDSNYDSPYGEVNRYRLGDAFPDKLYFNRIVVTWGDKKIVFNTNMF